VYCLRTYILFWNPIAIIQYLQKCKWSVWILWFSGEQQKSSNSVTSAAVLNDTDSVADGKPSIPAPVLEPHVVASQAPEPQLSTPSSKGQRNLQDSTFSISGESPNGLHEKESGRCVLYLLHRVQFYANYLASKVFPSYPCVNFMFWSLFSLFSLLLNMKFVGLSIFLLRLVIFFSFTS
jgi:hypothetical protein